MIAESKTMQEMVKWMSEVLLKEMSCALDFVQVTAFTLKTARLHGNMTLPDFSGQGGPAPSQDSGKAPQPKTKGSAVVEAAPCGKVAHGASRGSKATPSSADGNAARS